ncbi:MAG: filamentous hemagglutinin N-terminal domain-containing protein [Stigonema ocellatum SAG 48.90 = DSM 106950]|nr:filamentous hemagglutinin N-terminal domain-containing protein [Stigonema ocellatum SAG 48.90 = DSM 106950]
MLRLNFLTEFYKQQKYVDFNTILGLGMSFGGAFGVAVSLILPFSANYASAQITPDATLPNNSRVNPVGNTSIIEGGTQAGGNLFHSFQQFSVPTGSTAFFNNATDIQNIITRVTGKSISNIDGVIGANGTANLFVLNPNGIIFGRNARLDVGGSFVGTTANAIQFGNLGLFSASNPNTPSPLLIVNPSALLFNQIPTGSIESRSVATAGVDLSGNMIYGLKVPNGRSLLLFGGDVSVDGGGQQGGLHAFGGRIELGGLKEPGTVELSVQGNQERLSYPEGVAKADVSLANQGVINVVADNGGSIAINAGNFNLAGGSGLFAGIGSGLGTVNSQAGNIDINATKTVSIIGGGSGIYNQVEAGAFGNSGDINIKTGSLSLTALVSGTAAFEINNAAVLDTSNAGQGNAGNIQISVGSVSLTDGAILQASNTGQGNAGNIVVQAQDQVFLATSLILSNVGSPPSSQGQPQTQGNVGNILIDGRTVSLTDGAQLQAGFFSGSQGKAGIVSVRARDTLSVAGSVAGFNSGIFTNADPQTVGNGSDIQISARSVSFTDGGELEASNAGQGNTGNIIVQAQDQVSFAGKHSGIFINIGSANGSPAFGNVGNIEIDARTVSLTDGAQLQAGFFSGSQGNAGIVSVRATDTLSVAGKKSGIRTNAELQAVGNGSDIQISAGAISFTDGAELEASNAGSGNGGKITITAGSLSFDGSDAFSTAQVGSVGNAGNIDITARSLSLTNGAQLSTTSVGNGAAGNINIITAQDIRLDNQASIGANTTGGQGNIAVRSRSLILRGNSNITTNATGSQVIGGNINIDTDVLAALENSSIRANSANFRGGQIRINAQGIFRSNNQDITATGASPELNGIVQINTSDTNPSRGLLQQSTNLIDTNALIASSCISRSRKVQGSFTITGSGGLPNRPGDVLVSNYPTGDVRSITGGDASRPWQKGDPIVEPEGVYRLPSGHLVLSRECPFKEETR